MTSLLLAAPSVARPPRVASYPAYASTAGPEAVDLAASAGLVLDPWQAAILHDAMGERPDGSWAAFEVGVVVPRQNGKGAITEARELYGLFLAGEELILHSAHEFKTAAEAFRRIERTVKGCPHLMEQVKKITYSHGEEGIELRSGARLRFVARSSGSGRGFSGDCVILDEAYALDAEEMAALLPTLSARPNPQIWYTSTPPEAATALLMSLRKRGTEGGGRLAYFEYGAGTEGDVVDLDDPAVWRATNPALDIRITEEFVRGERDAMKSVPTKFATERCGVWPRDLTEGWAVISEEDWQHQRDPSSQPAEKRAAFSFGVAVNRDQTWSTVAVACWRGDGQRHIEVMERRRGTAWVVPWLIERVRKWYPCALVINAGSPAGMLIPPLEAKKIEVHKPTDRQIGQAATALVTAITGKGEDGDEAARDVWHRGQEWLYDAVKVAMMRDLGKLGLRTWDVATADGDISALDAVTLALWGHATRSHLALTGPPATLPNPPQVAGKETWRPSSRLKL